MKRIFEILSFIVFLTAVLKSQQLQFTIVPQPKELIKTNYEFSLHVESISLKLFMEDSSGIYIPANELKETFRFFKNIDVPLSQSSKEADAVINIGLPSEDKDFNNLCEQNKITLSEKIGDEGYSLLIKDKLILIAANKKAGLYYGIQTLKQLVRGNKNNPALPGVKISDYPDLKYRGILDDISRGPVPTMDFMKMQIRRMAELKLNFLQYYTENVVSTEKHKIFAPPDGSVTIEDWKELADYARLYHIMLIGNFQSFGHFEKILAHPEYAHLGESGTLLSPAFPESIELLRDIYSEMVPAFDAPFFCINADETFDLGKEASKKMVDSLGIAVVYTDQIKKIYNILSDYNVKTMMWGDIVLKYPESLKMLPKDIIMMTWGYSAQDSYSEMIEPFKNAGYEFTISPGVLNSYSTMPDYSESLPNINVLVRDGIHYGSLGMVCTIWDDGGSAFFSKDWYGVSYAADQSWNSSEYSINDFDGRFNSAVYADTTGNFTKSLWSIVSLTNQPVTDGLQEKLLWTKVIPDSGRTLRVGLKGWDTVLQILDSAEIILNHSEPFLYKSDYDYFNFTINQYRYFAELRLNLAEAAQLYAQAFVQNENKTSAAREKIIKALSLTADLRSRVAMLLNDYRILWLRENKTHALDKMLSKYQSHFNDLKDVESRLTSALVDLDKKSSLPAPISLRLGIEEGEGKYFKEWMMINPIPYTGKNIENSIDFLKEMGGELNAQPKVTQEFLYDGNTYRWRRTSSQYFDYVDLREEFPEANTNAVTYAFANITSPDDRIVTASIGSSDIVDVILNGEYIYKIKESKPLRIDEDTFPISLKKGKNNLMLKLIQGTAEWKFSFRLPEYDVSSSKNRYKIEEKND